MKRLTIGMSGPEIDIQKIGEAMSAGVRSRSPLMIWLIENHDEFAALLAKHGADWKGLAKQFSDAGLVSRSGNALTARTVETYWLRARRHVAKQATARRKSSGGRAASPAEPSGKTTTAFEPATPAEPAARPEPKFKPFKLRNEGRGVSDEERRALGDPTAPADPNDPRWSGDKSR